MATELENLDETILDEEIERLADELAQELEDELSEASLGTSKAGVDDDDAEKSIKTTPLKKKKIKADHSDSELEIMEDDDMEDDDKKPKKKAKKGDDEEDDDEEDMEESFVPETKQEMIRHIFETLKGTDSSKLAGSYAKLMDTLLGESAGDDEEDDLVAPVITQRDPITAEDLDISEDLVAIFGQDSEDLSEEFKTQVKTVFEAAVVSKINSEIETVEETFNTRLDEMVKDLTETLTDKVDNYLSYVVEQWVSDNELAIEHGIKTEITEDFIGGLKQLFEDHYVDIPEEKVDVVDSLADRVDELESKLNESIETNIELSSTVQQYEKEEAIIEVSEGLTVMEAEKLKGLSEGIIFEDSDQYKDALNVVKESYFSGRTASKSVVIDEAAEILEDSLHEEAAPTSRQMSAYVDTLNRTIVEN